jgi:hypothetical protein
MIKRYRNKKSGDTYFIESIVIDKTNARDGRLMYLYYAEKEPERKYVRDMAEFLMKFEEKP